MHKTVLFASVAAALVFGAARAEDKPANSQQNRMAHCNQQATGKTGDERKAFMKQCLSAPRAESQQDRMKRCNVEASGKKGDERKAFMGQCLKKSA